MSAHDGGEAAYGAFGVIGDEPGFPRGKAERGSHAVQEGAAEGIVIEEAVQVGSPAPAAASPKPGAFLLSLIPISEPTSRSCMSYCVVGVK